MIKRKKLRDANWPIKTLKDLDRNGSDLEKFFALPAQGTMTTNLQNESLRESIAFGLRDYNGSFSINNLVSSFLSTVVLITGIIIPMYMLQPEPYTWEHSVYQIAVFTGVTTPFSLAVLWVLYLMSPKEKPSEKPDC